MRLTGLLASDGGLSCASGSICCLIPFSTALPPLFAYSTVEHRGIVLLSAGLASPAAHYGAIYQVLSHTVTKSFCFFAAVAALLTVGTREIASVRGVLRSSPVAAAGLLVGGLAIASAPPFAVFSR